MIFLPIALILSIIGWLVKFKKMTWLISGYNTASKQKKEEYDKEKLCKYFGDFIFLLAGSYLLWGITLFILPEHKDLLIWCGFISSFIVIVTGIIYLNIGNKLKK
jgi:hypothetical protein